MAGFILVPTNAIISVSIIPPDWTIKQEIHMAIDLKSLNHAQLGDLIVRAQQRQKDLAEEKVVKLRERSMPS
ncbi:MAG: hypothetical protein ABI650_06740 [Dokdonella sp.]